MTDLTEASSLRARAETLAAPLPALLVAAERLATVVDLGVHGRRKAGMGESFWQFRRYGQQDPAAAIDWRRSARSQHLFVREREWEAAEAVWFWRDASPGMCFASGNELVRKVDRGNLLALALAILLIRGGERIALVGTDRTPASGRAVLSRFARALAESPRTDDCLPPHTFARKHGQLVWLSDFLSPTREIEDSLRRRAGSGMTGYLVHIVDPAEEDFPYAGRLRFESPRTGLNEIIGRAERVRDEYRERLQAHIGSVRDLAGRLGWNFLSHRTDHKPEAALIALYSQLAGVRGLCRQ